MKRLMVAALIAAMPLAAGCGGDETGPDEHVPHSAKLFGPTGTELTPAVTLARGQTVRVEVRFYDDQGAQETDIESEHYAQFTFSPATLATVAAVAGKRFTFDVTAQNAAGTGSVTVGFGHDLAADEASFGPFTVGVQ